MLLYTFDPSADYLYTDIPDSDSEAEAEDEAEAEAEGENEDTQPSDPNLQPGHVDADDNESQADTIIEDGNEDTSGSECEEGTQAADMDNVAPAPDQEVENPANEGEFCIALHIYRVFLLFCLLNRIKSQVATLDLEMPPMQPQPWNMTQPLLSEVSQGLRQIGPIITPSIRSLIYHFCRTWINADSIVLSLLCAFLTGCAALPRHCLHIKITATIHKHTQPTSTTHATSP